MHGSWRIVQLVLSRYYVNVDGGPIYALLERLTAVIRSAERQAGLDAGLQPVHLQILSFLSRANRYSDTPLALSEYLGIQKGTISQSVQILVREGLLARESDPRDGRVVHLALTTAGTRLLQRVAPPPVLRQALAADPARNAAVAEHLTALLRDLQQANGERTFGVCRTCRHLQGNGNRFRCGLTGEPLKIADTQKICREHATPEPTAAS